MCPKHFKFFTSASSCHSCASQQLAEESQGKGTEESKEVEEAKEVEGAEEAKEVDAAQEYERLSGEETQDEEASEECANSKNFHFHFTAATNPNN